jgi:hypothetical protein
VYFILVSTRPSRFTGLFGSAIWEKHLRLGLCSYRLVVFWVVNKAWSDGALAVICLLIRFEMQAAI